MFFCMFYVMQTYSCELAATSRTPSDQRRSKSTWLRRGIVIDQTMRVPVATHHKTKAPRLVAFCLLKLLLHAVVCQLDAVAYGDVLEFDGVSHSLEKRPRGDGDKGADGGVASVRR